MPFLVGSFYFFYFAIIAIHVIFMPKVLNMLGYAPSQIGIIFASAPLVRFALPFLFLQGLKLSRSVFNAALLILLGGALGFYPALNSFEALIATNIALGIGLSLILPYIEVIALEQIGKARYGKIRLFGSIGFILVALLLVKSLTSPYIALLYLLISVTLTSAFGYVIARNEQRHSKVATPLHVSISIFSHPFLWIALLTMQISFGPFYNFFTIHATAHGVSLDTTIYLWSFGVIIEIIMFYFQAPLLQRNLLKLLQIAALATALRWYLIYLFPSNLSVLFFTQSLHALSFALFHTAAMSYLFTLYDNKKLTQQFFFGVSYGLGGFVGALGSGYIYEYWPDKLFLSAALVALMTFAALVMAQKRNTKYINNQ